MNVRSEYDVLLDLGDLRELYPNLKGIWEKDKKDFTYIWEQKQAILGDIDVNNFEEF